MSKKKKIISWLIVFFIWNSAVVGFHIFMRSQLEFPTLNFESLGWFAWSIPIFMTVPFYGLFFGILSVYRKKLMKAFAVLFTVVGILAYLGFVVISTNFLTDWTPGIYPLMSETENASDYLVLDGTLKDEYDQIVKILPETIPEEAKNVKYKYTNNPLEGSRIELYFELPEDKYETFKDDVQKNQEENPYHHDNLNVGFNDINFSIYFVVNDYYGGDC